MSTIFVRLTVGAALAAMGAFGATDNTLGTWKVNMEKSKFSPSAPYKNLTVTREANDGGAKVTTTGERADGVPINSSYTATYDGKEFSVTGAPYDRMTIKQVNAKMITYTAKKTDGKYSATGRAVVSKDGKMMTNTNRGINAEGKPFHNAAVFDKQ